VTVIDGAQHLLADVRRISFRKEFLLLDAIEQLTACAQPRVVINRIIQDLYFEEQATECA